MTSQNFEFLRPTWEDLATLGAFAEQYALPDPSSATVKLRTFAEQVVQFLYHRLGLPRPYQNNLNDLLTNASFAQAVPRVIVGKLHSLRIHGNRAAHGEAVPAERATWLLQEAHELGRWLHVSHANGSAADCPPFTPPSAAAGTDTERKLRREKTAILAHLAAQEVQMRALLAELEAARAGQTVPEATGAQLDAALARGQAAADTLSLSEEATRRRLIESLLASAGWDVGALGASTESVGQEVTVLHQPTPTRRGKADYVLWGTNGKPLAVIEAKKTSADAEIGRTQAKCYADGFEKSHDQRPIIFYTNGHDVWIWNDAQDEPPRKLYGFYSRDSLEYLLFQRKNRESLVKVQADPVIAGRIYQIEAIRRVAERFAARHRSALIVQATGTGKTRVAVSLCELLLRARWAKRILFLCDRRELRKQARNVFKEFLPGEPRTYVTASTSKERDKRIYLATYPAMMECFESFDVGFFDLILADESHRSIYNRYRDLFAYFDALQVGLTATPVEFIARNTYRIFGCEDRDPTAYFSYEDAITHTPPYLVPFEVVTHTTPFLRKGIKYSEMTDAQRTQLDEDEEIPAAIEYDQAEVDKVVFNKDTNRIILRNLMENGIRDASGTRVGKSIVFARNHNHAVLLQNLFDEMYPQYGGKFCRVIDTYDPRAEALIDDFKGEGSNPELTVAISVDMLDTGIDVPEVVNLVFAKPVYSRVKFWQMIGRGTRLRKDLFGPGRDKTHFLIFDHWKNFEFFDQHYQPVEPRQEKSLPQRVFEARVRLAETALEQGQPDAFETAVKLIAADVRDLPRDTIAVREKWKEVQAAANLNTLRQFAPATRVLLLIDIAPLMQWRNIGGHEAAHAFDLHVCRLQTELLKGSASVQDLRAETVGMLDELRTNLAQVKAVAPTIAEARTAEFWGNLSVAKLEEVRDRLRGVMQYRMIPVTPSLPPKVIDVTEDPALIERGTHAVQLDGLQLAAYRNRVEKVLRELFETNETLQRIQQGRPVSPTDLEALTSLVLTQDPMLNLNDLVEYYPDCAGQLDLAIRGIIGLDARAVHERFTGFVQQTNLTAAQIRFLDLLQNHIARYGSIEIARLYEPPFTSLHTDSLDGLFPDALIDELLALIQSFKAPSAA
ncbi:DEAD/DEAH box helicase family protein [Aquisphaera insulae]|uniref:DEAD/DEAH box helicase family protein n=1 Tax=Aquisphaera insulae TaxID=2712864 RepID=UPI0013EAF98E|nr:DEAD/DEAH box helicase family protein [Aquisphaera insulae]